MKNSLVRGACAALFALALSACSHKAPPAPPPPQVGVTTVQPQNVPLTTNLVGRVSAYRSANVVARVGGVLTKWDYQAGSKVKKGQLLFQIDPAPYRAALASAQGQLAEAQASYTNARVNAKRAQKMAPKGYISKQDLDNALATERTDKAAVQAAEAAVQTAQINLGYTRVTSPITGRAGEQQVTEGAIVGSGTSDVGSSGTMLTTVSQVNPLYVNFTISVNELDELRHAAKAGELSLSEPDKATVKVTLPDGTPYPESGSVDFSSPTVDASTGAVNLRAVLPNPEFELLPGSYVHLTLTLGERHHVYLVPQAAVQQDTAGNYVFVVDRDRKAGKDGNAGKDGKDGKVARSDIVTSGMDGNDWIVTSGLKPGDKVIVTGIQDVQAGGPAKATPWQPPAPAASSGGGGGAPAPTASSSGASAAAASTHGG